MLVKQARALARRWVSEEASDTPGFGGAFYHGSANWLPDDATLPATSDLDVLVVRTGAEPAAKPGKFVYHGVMLDVSYVSMEQLRSAEAVLGQAELAGSFHRPSVIADPSGQLTAVQTAVARDYAKRRWVSRRVQHAHDKVVRRLAAVRDGDPFHAQVTSWLFGTGVTTHMLLIAGLRNPTVRRRYLATRELLAEYGQLDFYETLLTLLGCAHLSQERVAHHLAALAEAFDAAKAVIHTPFFFAADISDLARPVAIDGSRELIAGGGHREAVFWIVATASRCQQVFAADAPAATRERFHADYRRLLADLGLESFADLQRRGGEVEAALPRVWTVADAIMAANPGIADD